MGVAGPPRRWLTFGIWLLAMVAGIVLIARSQFSADLSAFLPASPDARQRVLIEQLQAGVASRTLMIGIEGGADAAQRAEFSRSMAAEMRAGGRFEQVQNGDAADWTEAGQWLFQHRYQLSPAVTPDRFTVAGLRDAIDETLSLLGTPAGSAIRPLLEQDPTGEMQRIAEGLIPASAPRSEGGVWVSRHAPRAVLLASTRASGGDLDAQALAIAQIRQAFDHAVGKHGRNGAAPRLLVSGPPACAVESRDKIKSEAIHLATVGGIVMSVLLLLAFASPRALFIALLPVATGVVAGTAAVGVVYGTVHGLTMGFGSTLIGETVDYAIYYLIQARPRGDSTNTAKAGWRHWCAMHWPTVRLGMLTSVCGFAALVFSGFPGLAQLGVFSLAGLVAAALATRYVLPVLAPDGASGQGLRRRLARLAGAIVHALPRLRWIFTGLGVAALALLLWQGGHLWRADLAAMSPVPPSALALDAELREDLGASDGRILVVVQGTDQQATLRAAEAASERLDSLIGQGGNLAGFETVTRLLPSIAVQQARLASLPDASVLRPRLIEAIDGGPLSAAKLEPFIADLQAARTQAPVQHADLQAGPLAGVINALMFERLDGGWSALNARHAGKSFDEARLRNALADLPEVQVIDIKRELDRLYDHYLHAAFVQVLPGALAVLALLGMWLRSWRRLLSVSEPLIFAVVLTLGGLALAGTGLGMLHLVGLLLVVAVGANYALFFGQVRETGQADEDTLASLLFANLTTVVSFGLIAISDIPALSSIGRVVAPGALLALLLSAAFVRTGKRPTESADHVARR